MERVLDIQSNFIPTSDSPHHLHLAVFGEGVFTVSNPNH